MRVPNIFLVALATAFLASRRAPPSPTDLLGQPFAAALASYGTPDLGTGDGDTQAWVWIGTDQRRHRVDVHAGVIVRVDPALATAEIAPRVPADVYPSQPVAEALQRLGNPDSVRRASPMVAASPGGPGAPYGEAALIYGQRHVLVAGGRVLRIVLPPPLPSGPR